MTRKTRVRRGLSVIEAAILFPVLLLLTVGIIEYGWLFMQSQHITNAARQSARIGARPDATNADVAAACTMALANNGMGGAAYTMTVTPGDVSLPDPGEMITVRVEVAYSEIGLSMPLLPVPASLASTVTMAKEGP